MNVKIDTKEKFSVVTPQDSNITVNMAAELEDILLKFQSQSIPHLIINMQAVKAMDNEVSRMLANLQQLFYEKNVSCIVCCLNADVENKLEELELLEFMNVTPTESEAWDIMHMEEVERELLDDENF